jgi:hypothetical protein
MTDMTDKSLFIEEILINSLKSLLAGRTNEFLGEMEYPIPPIEFGRSSSAGSCLPIISLSTCERTEKERIVRVEAYSLTIVFTVPEGEEAERYCYAYAASVAAALTENPTLGGVVDWAELTGKKYVLPKHPGAGEDWETILTLRITVERS